MTVYPRRCCDLRMLLLTMIALDYGPAVVVAPLSLPCLRWPKPRLIVVEAPVDIALTEPARFLVTGPPDLRLKLFLLLASCGL